MAATRTPLVSRPSIEASPVRRAASQASAISAIVGAVSTGDSGSAYTDTPRSVTPVVTPASSPGSTRLATTATTSHPAARIAATPTSAAARTSVAARSWPETTHTTGRARVAALRGSARVQRELAGAARLGEVAPHDEDAVAARGQRPEPLDDLRHRLVLVGEDLGVRDPEARLVRFRLRQARKEKVDGRVGSVHRRDDRPEDPESVDPPDEQVEQSQRDGGPARPRLACRHVQPVGHPRLL